MDCEVRLRVQTVLTLDPVTHEVHTAYSVFRQDQNNGMYHHVPGWTLKDAIENYCKWFGVERSRIKVLRPFLPQRAERYDCQ